jgi:hypothetical protein
MAGFLPQSRFRAMSALNHAEQRAGWGFHANQFSWLRVEQLAEARAYLNANDLLAFQQAARMR